MSQIILNRNNKIEDYVTFNKLIDRSITTVTEDMLSGGTSISDYSFSYCSSLVSVFIPSSITNIGKAAFGYCSSLVSILIPSSITNIGDSAFGYCSSLVSILIPSSITNIGDSAFSQCVLLSNVTVKSVTPPTLDGSIFFNTPLNLVIYVPPESVETYKSDSGWSRYANKIQPIPT